MATKSRFNGWLHKRGRLVASWKRRFFVLDHGVLQYFADPKDEEPRGQLSLFGLGSVHVRKADGAPHASCMEIRGPDRVMVVCAEKKEDLDAWQRAIAEGAEEVSGRKLAPSWADGDKCGACEKPFSLTRRKHHCRHCGGLFCDDDSRKRVPLPLFGMTEPVRVCDACVDAIAAERDQPANGEEDDEKHEEEPQKQEEEEEEEDEAAKQRERQAMARLRVEAATKIQAVYRAHSQRGKYLDQRRRHKAAVAIQRVYRGHHARSLFREELERAQREAETEEQKQRAAVMIQAGAKGWRARKQYASLKAQKQRVAAQKAKELAHQRQLAEGGSLTDLAKESLQKRTDPTGLQRQQQQHQQEQQGRSEIDEEKVACPVCKIGVLAVYCIYCDTDMCLSCSTDEHAVEGKREGHRRIILSKKAAFLKAAGKKGTPEHKEVEEAREKRSHDHYMNRTMTQEERDRARVHANMEKMKAGTRMTKLGKWGAPKATTVSLQRDDQSGAWLLCWASKSKSQEEASLALNAQTKIIRGQQTKLFLKAKNQEKFGADKHKSFSVQGASREVDLVCETEADHRMWVETLFFLCRGKI